MNILEKQLKKIESLFEEGKPLAKWYPLYEALDTFLMTPGKIAPKAPYVRDAVDIKRVMIFVVVALIPATLMGIYNAGLRSCLPRARPLNWGQPDTRAKALRSSCRTRRRCLGGPFCRHANMKSMKGFLSQVFYALVLPPTMPPGRSPSDFCLRCFRQGDFWRNGYTFNPL